VPRALRELLVRRIGAFREIFRYFWPYLERQREGIAKATKPRSSTRPQSRFLALDDRPPGELTGLCRPQVRPNELLSHDPTLGVLCWKVEHSGDANKVGKLAGTSPPEGN